MTCSSSSLVRGYVFESETPEETSQSQEHLNFTDFNFQKYHHLDYLEFEDSVYDFDWSTNDPWVFAAISFNSHLHINFIPDDIKYKIMIY